MPNAAGERVRTRRPTAPKAPARPRVGVLSLQGDFSAHAVALAVLGVEPVRVSLPEDVAGLQALVLPGGESSAMLRLFDYTGLRTAVEAFVRTKPVLGTCAGAILLAHDADRLPRPPLAVIDVDVQRNGYGRQVHSFVDAVDVKPLKGPAFNGVFIRAPRFVRIGPGVEVIATHKGEPVGVRQRRAVAIAFHPEISGDLRFHRWFLSEVAGLDVKGRTGAARRSSKTPEAA